MSRKINRIFAVLIALIVWQVAAVCVSQPLLLPSPTRVLIRLSQLLAEPSFWNALLSTLSGILIGLMGGIIAGILLAVPASKFNIVEDLLWPFMITIRTVPVVSFIILCLMWLSARRLPGFIAFLMVLPIIYNNVLAGLRATDDRLNEMAQVFDIPFFKRIVFVIFPQLLPQLKAGLATATGLAWKAGVAAELIGIPSGTIGEFLYRSKVYFETADLFAWTLVIILLSVITEKILLSILNLVTARINVY